jgi:hypothetical protein
MARTGISSGCCTDNLVLLRRVLTVPSGLMGLVVERNLMLRWMTVAGCALHTHLLWATRVIRGVTILVARNMHRRMSQSRRRH